jgi:two-component system phosphate regulon sensor histidine kinase PhoR
MKMKKKKLFWQLYPLYLLITLLSLVAVIWYSSEAMQEFFLDQTAADVEERAHLVSSQVMPLLIPINQSEIDAVCKNIGAASSTRITVILSSGQVLGDSDEKPAKMDNHADRPEIVGALKGNRGVSIRYSRTLEERMIYVAIPLFHPQGTEVFAVLRSAISITPVMNELRYIQSNILFGGVIIALIASGISLIVSRRISRPIEEMKKGAEHFAEGDLSYRLHVPASEELGGLARAMNRMASQLNDRMQTVIRQRNENEAVLSSMSEGVIALDREEHIININRAAAEMFGCSPSQSGGRNIREIARNSDLHRFISKSLSGEEPAEADIIFYHDGERILHIHSTPLCLTENERIGILIVMNDVTRLRQLENIRRDFVANVSHEIKTPLTAIQGFVETLRHGALNNPDEAERFLGIIEKHVGRLAAIIDDLMHLSKIEQEKENKGIPLEPGRIKDIILTAVQVCQTKAADKNIQIDLNCDDEMNAAINPPLLEQAVVNLIDNAVKYSEDGSTVQISAVMTDAGIDISIQDHGIGIAKEHLPRLFERFYRVDKARSRKLGGTGLGLAIVKHIVQAHNGNIFVDSNPGEGSIFTIHLPL